jgi:hypothetical protein
MNTIFFKRVCVLTVSLVTLSSLGYLWVYANEPTDTDSKTTTLTGICDGTVQIMKSHEIDFGSFTTSEVVGGTKTNQWVKTGAGAVLATSLSNSQGGIISDVFMSVKDDCGLNDWTLSLQYSDLTSLNGHKVFGDNIGVTGSTNYYILDWLNLANPEVDAKELTIAPSGPMIYQPTYSNIWSGSAIPVAILTRFRGVFGTKYGAEYWVNLFFTKRLPQFQPAGSYTGTVVLTLTVD